MLDKHNVRDEEERWRSGAYHVAARYREYRPPGVVLHYTEVEPGGRILPHAPKRPEILFFLEGDALVTVDGIEGTCREGDWLAASRTAVRGIANMGPGRLRYLSILPAAIPWRPKSFLRRFRRDGGR